ncbi:Sugar or nucleoside kinase, ribokinase family [Monaibacterium marinum]|uniref:Sugar or nucleoside kinase, ribokinase family n=1 Tax=Pontivivens marinum TaxID=1690039 RepID=A0A2C9CPZ8_9RHOB|nr:PfkB family carbohydrate kinase [Monaibacterium marinum]SOH93287.1 Sugar or nucleoside kinase, ribokinase family [Monaibacterium marinum]
MKDSRDTRRSVACAGRLYCDLVFSGAGRLPAMGQEVFAEGLSLHAGGGAFITAAWLSALDRPAELVATLPAAPFEQTVRAQIADAGIIPSGCATAPYGTDPQITVALPLGGDRAFLTRRAGPALPANVSLDRVGHLHIGELHSLLEHPELIPAARAAGITISLDCGWEDDISPEAAKLIAAVDIFLPNEGEATKLAEAGFADLAPLTVIKCGADGARARIGGVETHVPTNATTVMDATGAGDAFNAGFLDAWLDGKPLDACLAAGNRTGTAAVSALGGTGGISQLEMS